MTEYKEEVDRIEAAKEAIATAITGKGVTVPDGTLIDGMAALIESIEAGGSGGELQIREGVFTISGTDPVSRGVKLIAVDGLDITPKAVVIFQYNTFNPPTTTNKNMVAMCYKYLDSETITSRVYYALGASRISHDIDATNIVFTADGFEWYTDQYPNMYCKAQYQYTVLGV